MFKLVTSDRALVDALQAAHEKTDVALFHRRQRFELNRIQQPGQAPGEAPPSPDTGPWTAIFELVGGPPDIISSLPVQIELLEPIEGEYRALDQNGDPITVELAIDKQAIEEGRALVDVPELYADSLVRMGKARRVDP